MKEDRIVNQSRVADLHPSDSKDIRFTVFKNSQRYHGSFRQKLRRPSRTPAFSRPYVPGDPVRLIDWKVFAKSDQTLIREEHDESSSRVLVCVDVNETMNWPPFNIVDGLTYPKKIDIALRIALNLAFIHLRMADYVKVTFWDSSKGQDSGPSRALAIRNSSDVLSTFEQMLERKFEISSIETEKFLYSGRNFDISYWISDCLGPSCLRWMSDNSVRGKLIHCLSDAEIDLSWLKTDHCYFDHSRDLKEFLGRSLMNNKKYQSSINEWRKNIVQDSEDLGISYQLVTGDTSIHMYQDQLAVNICSGN